MLRRCGGAVAKDSRMVDQQSLSRRSGTSTYFLQEHHLWRWRRSKQAGHGTQKELKGAAKPGLKPALPKVNGSA